MDTFIWIALGIIIVAIAIATILTSVNKYSSKWTSKYFDTDHENKNNKINKS